MKKLFSFDFRYFAAEIGSERQHQQHMERDNQWLENSFDALFNGFVEMLLQPHTGSLYVPRLVRSNSSNRGGTVLA